MGDAAEEIERLRCRLLDRVQQIWRLDQRIRQLQTRSDLLQVHMESLALAYRARFGEDDLYRAWASQVSDMRKNAMR